MSSIIIYNLNLSGTLHSTHFLGTFFFLKSHHNQQQQNAQDVTSSLVTTSTNRERQLQIQVDDLQLAIKEQQETFAQEKRELV